MGYSTITITTFALGLVALGYTFWKSAWVSKQEVGTERMGRIAENIADGAMAFLKALSLIHISEPTRPY